jgi:4-hydroxy-tetrahydrodipicolinate synthase
MRRNNMELKGTYTALITPFKGDVVDYNGLRQLINFQIKNEIDGLLLLGTTGEAPTLTWDEQEEVIKVAIDEIAGRLPIMVGTGTNATKKTIENTMKAKRLGADMALIVTPYYNKPSDEGIYQHFKTITENVDIPVVVYNIQGRTGKNIETATLKKISELNNIIGVKEASGNINQMMDVIKTIALSNSQFSVMCGDDALTLPLISLGGKGIISVVSNIIPGGVVNMVNAALRGDFASARKIHFDILPLIKGIFIETNPIPVKTAMNMLNMPAGAVRLPLYEMSNENMVKLRNVMLDLELIESKISA